MSFVAEPVRADCCCGFDEVQTEGRTITVQARCDACPQHGRYLHRQPSPGQAARRTHRRRPSVTKHDSDIEQDWYFTFGAGHRGHALLHADYPPTGELGEGFRLDNRYVILHGTYDAARARMGQIFGQVWSAAYANAEDAGVEEFGLTELVIV